MSIRGGGGGERWRIGELEIRGIGDWSWNERLKRFHHIGLVKRKHHDNTVPT